MFPRQLFNGFLVFAALCLGIINAHAQTGADVAAQTQQEIEAAELTEIRQLAADALYEEAVVRATVAIENTAQPDRELFYLRGYARHYLSRYEKSIEDVKDLGDYKPVGDKWPKASSIVRYCERCIAARPPNKHLLQLLNGTWIHIYYGEENEFTRNATRDAAQGFQAASQFFGVKTSDVSLFLFTEAEHDQFVAFKKASLNSSYIPWAQLFYSLGSIVLSQKSDLGEVLKADTPLLKSITHEFSHVLVAQIVGRYPKLLPPWMTEGIANVGAATVDPNLFSTNDRIMRYLLKQDAIFPMQDVTKDWGALMDKTKVKGEEGSPYMQGLHMTRYLQMRLARAGKG